VEEASVFLMFPIIGLLEQAVVDFRGAVDVAVLGAAEEAGAAEWVADLEEALLYRSLTFRMNERIWPIN